MEATIFDGVYPRLRVIECQECWVVVDEQYLRARSNDVGECWEWAGSTTTSGQPDAPLQGRRRKSVRRVFILQNRKPGDRPLPTKWRAAVRCENPRCVRPDHMVVITTTQAMARNMKRGNEELRRAKIRASLRRIRGIISDEQRTIILTSDKRPFELSKEIGVKASSISYIRRQARPDRQGPHAGASLGVFSGLVRMAA